MTQSVDTVGPVILDGPGECAKSRIRKRAWCLTIFDDELQYPDNATYNLICKDTTKDGKIHYHQYLYFKNAISFNTVKKMYPTAHIQGEISQGAYIQYIKGNANGRKEVIFEDGNAPCKHRFPSIRQVEQMTQDERKDLPAQYFNIVDKINKLEANDIKVSDIYKPNIKVIWIFGPSGVGKTKRALDEVGPDAVVNMVKFDGSFWHGIGTAKIAIYDDFRDSHMKPSEFINFIDYNIHPLNIKGGSVMNKYETIYITSIQDPYWIYQGMRELEEPRKQWMRRMQIIELKADDDDDE